MVADYARKVREENSADLSAKLAETEKLAESAKVCHGALEQIKQFQSSGLVTASGAAGLMAELNSKLQDNTDKLNKVESSIAHLKDPSHEETEVLMLVLKAVAQEVREIYKRKREEGG